MASKKNERDDDMKTPEEIAREIATDLFTDGAGKPALRLVMDYVGNAGGTGWSLEPAVDRIAKSLRESSKPVPEAIQPDMWWDPESPENAITEPMEAWEDNQYAEPGDTFRLWCAKRLPDAIYTLIKDGDDVSYRDATPEEIAEHVAHEQKEKARRKAEMDAENAARRARTEAAFPKSALSSQGKAQ